jgi:hypothetical protein
MKIAIRILESILDTSFQHPQSYKEKKNAWTKKNVLLKKDLLMPVPFLNHSSTEVYSFRNTILSREANHY